MQYRIIKYDQFAKLNFCEKFDVLNIVKINRFIKNDFFFVDL